MLKPHISDADLIRFADGELPVKAISATETHLRTCSKCRARLDELKRGADAYDRYHAQLLRPSLELPQEWSSFSVRLKTIEGSYNRFFPTAIQWWAAAALLISCLAIAWFLQREPVRRMQQLLTRAALAPTPPHRRLQVMVNGQVWYRAATLQYKGAHPLAAEERGLEETRALFVKANYNWDTPLSARSFAAWRRHLPNKRDHVVSIEDSEGKNRFYRLQTETSAGVLRVAALTLRADTLSPVKGAFHFEHQNDITIEDAGEMPESPGKFEAKNDHPLTRPAVVKQVGPAEELRIFAALDAIGADVGESVTVDIAKSKQQVIVAAVGLSPDRERQIRQALAPIPNTKARFTSGQATALDRSRDTGTSPPASNDAPLRHMLEQQAGGAQQFQAIADKALDASSTILQRAHALYILAQKFPPSVASQFDPSEQEILRSLHHHHAIAIEQAAAELKDALLPLLRTSAAPDETQTQRDTSWQVGAVQLYEEAKALDASLGRILAGTYSQEAGQSIRSKLPDEIRRMETLALSQENSP